MPGHPIYPPDTTINDRYVLGTKLGSDGNVYESYDRHLDTTVALKILHPVDGAAQSWDEAQRLQQLESRFLVKVMNADVIMSSDLRFIVTPLLSGGDLEGAAAGMGLSLSDAVRFSQQTATGLGRIHAAGMVHRDVKPANVLQQGGEVLLADLERCALVDDSGRASRDGSWCTVAPEAAGDNGFCTASSDIYSLGATAFYLLSGQYPVDHRLDRAEQKVRVETGRIREIRDLAPHVPQAIGTVVRRALHMDPQRRHATAEDFGNALVQAAKGRRNWRRVSHEGHIHCLKGEPFRGRAGVVVCAIPDDGRFSVVVRRPPTSSAGSPRRVAGVADECVAGAALAKHLQRRVASLS